MGIGVSGWRLARAVSEMGQLGVVSGTALDSVLIRRLQNGDVGGHVRRALEHFPYPEIAEKILDRYFIEGGKAPNQPYRSRPVPALPLHPDLEELFVVSNFVEVFLAKEGHDGQVGINYLEKVQLPTLPSLYGAMLANVDWVLMGAGIPRTIPGVLNRFAEGEAAELKVDVHGASREDNYRSRFDPAAFVGGEPPVLPRPKFLPIIASVSLATMLLKRADGWIDGFIVEGPTAGGHNAPPRGRLELDEAGEPIYGPRDVVDMEAMRKLGVPFWLAGSYGEPDRVAEALREGAAGVQVGTAFAYCEESDLAPELKQRVLEASRRGEATSFTDPLASPTGFPFKVVLLPGTLSDQPVYESRRRVCDLAYLRQAYKKPDGTLGWRCPAEPVSDYVRKGGQEEETHRRKCLCNALMANIGLPQVHSDGRTELPLVTSGNDVAQVARFLKPGASTYTAREVVEYLLAGVRPAAVVAEPS
ncbi:MAG: nitronate monooxygenase [Planctomycetes bacterium]|nr:nitronate monooxygenase [Planctomycetota bacterium]